MRWLLALTLVVFSVAPVYSASLLWDQPDPESVEGWRIYTAPEDVDASYSQWVEVSKAQATLQDDGSYRYSIEAGFTGQVFFRAKAFNADGESDWSNTASAAFGPAEKPMRLEIVFE